MGKALEVLAFISCLTTSASAQSTIFDTVGLSGQSLGSVVGFIGDLDGDGFDELAFSAKEPSDSNPQRSRVFLASSRTGQISLMSPYVLEHHVFMHVDIDGDGTREIGFWNSNQSTLALRSAATGAFYLGQSVYAPCFGALAPASAGDLNGDGTVDFVNTSTCAVLCAWSGVDCARIMSVTEPNNGFFSRPVPVEDQNGDLRDEILVLANFSPAPNQTSYEVRLLAGLTGTVMRTWPVPTFVAYGDVGDLTGDGVNEYVVNNAVYTMGIPGALLTFSPQTQPAGLATRAGDTNGDGHPDFAIGSPNTGTGGSQGRIRVYSGLDGSVITTLLGTTGSALGEAIDGNGDFNGDGLMDVAVGAPSHVAGTALSAGRVLVVSGSPAPPTGYCTAKINSLGCGPFAWATGIPSQSGSDTFSVHAGNVVSNKSGILFWGRQPNAVPFVGGTLCVSSPFVRSAILHSGGSPSGSDCSGQFSYVFTQAYMQQYQLSVGSTVFSQFWYRDPGFSPPANVGLTDAVRFTVTF